MIRQRWLRVSDEKVLEVDLVEVPPTPWPDGTADVTAELRTLEGEVFQRYTTVEKARGILVRRGFRQVELVDAGSLAADEPRRVV